MIFLEFDYIFTICVILVIVLMYLFYVKYPCDKDVEEPRKSNGSGNECSRDEAER